jgi:5-methylcytosine-specific restriction endonuclease McrA
MPRSVDEWIGKTPDSRPPKSVLIRIFNRCDGVCHISGRKILPGMPWQAEHIKPLSMGGENRESNLAPALVEPHKEKTAAEAGVRAKADRIAKRHLGLTKSKRPIQSAGFAKVDKEARRAEKHAFYHNLAEGRRPIGRDIGA